MDLLLINDENKSNFVYIKDFNTLMFSKIKCKSKSILVDIVYSDLVVKEYW